MAATLPLPPGIVGAASQAMGVASRSTCIKPGPILGPDEQAAAATRPNENTFTVKVQVRRRSAPECGWGVPSSAARHMCAALQCTGGLH